jgi:hypothetical protein
MTAQTSRTVSETAPSGAPVPVTGPSAAAERVISDNSIIVRVGDLRLELPPPDQLVFLTGLGILAALDLVEWPIALVVAVGHELARSHHGKALREFGEALEEV